MKGKKIFLISSILAALGLVGGTFAAWAVTDNANPFSVKITPGTLDVGSDKAVTLDWGTKGLVDIENLEMGQRKGPYEVGLVATTSDASSFEGSLTVTLSSTATGEEKLIDRLTVTVYENSAGTGDAWLTVPDGLSNYTISKDITVTNKTEKKLYFFIELKAEIAPQVYNAIKSDVVTLTVDWNKGSKTQVVTASTYYYNNSSSWEHVYAYAWKASDGSSNATWPGIEMKQEKGAVYSVAIPTDFDSVIFTDGNENQTADLALPDPAAATPYYNGSAWAAKPDLSAETVYYLVGTHNGWTTSSACQLVAASGTANNGAFAYTHKIENFNIAAGGELKIVSSENDWYAESADSDANMKIGQAGAYDFFFNPTAQGGVHIFCQQHNA